MRPRSALILFLLLACKVQAIVGGKPTADNEAPWMVALTDSRRTDIQACLDSGGTELFCQHFCGGVIISSSWLLTAAHCTETLLTSPQHLRLVAFGASLDDPEATLLEVAEVHIHPEYWRQPRGRYHYDISLLKLKDPLPEEYAASIASAADTDDLLESISSHNDHVRALGYGRLSSTGDFPAQLHQVDIDLLPHDACESVYNSDGTGITYYHPNEMLCAAEQQHEAVEADDAGDPEPLDINGEGVCTYDSGGPLFDAIHSGRLVGIISFGESASCADPAFPSVHTRISSLLDWIEDISSQRGAPLGDIGIALNGDVSGPTGSSREIEVRLANNSVTKTFNSGSFIIDVDGGVIEDFSDNGLNCQPISTGLYCVKDGPIYPSESGLTKISIVRTTSDSQWVGVTARIVSDAGQDYRQDNNAVTMQLAFTDSPFLDLQVQGVVATGDGNNGGIHLFATLSNPSHLSANSVMLSLASLHDEDYQLSEISLDGCDLYTATCPLGNLLPGDTIEVQAILQSPGMRDGFLVVAANFQDTDRVQRELPIKFLTVTAPVASRSSALGGAGLPVWFIIIFALSCKRRITRAHDRFRYSSY
jgi:trypsin